MTRVLVAAAILPVLLSGCSEGKSHAIDYTRKLLRPNELVCMTEYREVRSPTGLWSCLGVILHTQYNYVLPERIVMFYKRDGQTAWEFEGIVADPVGKCRDAVQARGF